MIVFLILFSLLGIKHPPIGDEMLKDFTVSELLDETTTDCSENPASGGPMNQSLKIELVEPVMPDDTGIMQWLNSVSTPLEYFSPVTPFVVPVRPSPDPQPGPKPIQPDAITPEPPVALVVMAAALVSLFLLGRRTTSRPSR